MTAHEKPVEELRDGNVIQVCESEYPLRVHRVRRVSCYGHPWVELIVSNTKMPLLGLDDLYYARGWKIKVLLD